TTRFVLPREIIMDEVRRHGRPKVLDLQANGRDRRFPGVSRSCRPYLVPGIIVGLTHNYRVIPGLAMRCEAEHCEGKGTHSPKELLRHRMGALPEPWSRFGRHGSPGVTRVVSH